MRSGDGEVFGSGIRGCAERTLAEIAQGMSTSFISLPKLMWGPAAVACPSASDQVGIIPIQ